MALYINVFKLKAMTLSFCNKFFFDRGNVSRAEKHISIAKGECILWSVLVFKT